MDAQIQTWRALSAAAVSDALDRLGIIGQCHGIRPLDHRFRLVGRAFTVRYTPVGAARGTVGDYIEDVGPGEVVVLDNAGRLDCTVWGDILTEVAHMRSLAGTVIHGACRDMSRSLELGYPIFSRGVYMRTGKDRVQAEAYNIAVALGEVRVEPGDLVLGDADGVIIVPRAREHEVLESALSIEQKEKQIRAAIAAGRPLAEARRSAGYHELQRRRDPDQS